MSSVVDLSALHWREETQTLEGWTLLGGRKIYARVPREMVHSLAMYNDSLGWEIEQFKDDIIQRLAPSLLQDAAE
jgi:hypothetical protein